MWQNLRSSFHCFAGVHLLSLVIAAQADEGGAGHYAAGSFASFVDVLPGKPGLGASTTLRWVPRPRIREVFSRKEGKMIHPNPIKKGFTLWQKINVFEAKSISLRA